MALRSRVAIGSIRQWLNKWKDDRNNDARDEHSCNQAPIANVLVSHVQTGDGRSEEAYRHDEEEDLQRQRVRLRNGRAWRGRSRGAELGLVRGSDSLLWWRQLS